MKQINKLTSEIMLQNMKKYFTDNNELPIEYGYIDSTYTGTGKPKIKFDGEETVSGKAYMFLNSYHPKANDRVIILCNLILGKADDKTDNLGGTTAERPTSPSLYEKYWDTTLSKLITWTGSNWMDSMGTIV